MQRLNLCFALLIDFFTILFFAGDGKRRKKVGPGHLMSIVIE